MLVDDATKIDEQALPEVSPVARSHRCRMHLASVNHKLAIQLIIPIACSCLRYDIIVATKCVT